MAIKRFATVPNDAQTTKKTFKLHDWYYQTLPKFQSHIVNTPEYSQFSKVSQSEVGRWILWQVEQISDEELLQYNPNARTKSADITNLRTIVPPLYPAHLDQIRRIQRLFEQKYDEDLSEAGAFRVAYQAVADRVFPIAQARA